MTPERSEALDQFVFELSFTLPWRRAKRHLDAGISMGLLPFVWGSPEYTAALLQIHAALVAQMHE